MVKNCKLCFHIFPNCILWTLCSGSDSVCYEEPVVYGPSIFYSEESKAEFIINQIYQFGKNGKIIWPDFMLKFKVNTDKIFFHSSEYIPEIIYTNSFNRGVIRSRARRLELDVDDNEIERLLKCDDIYDLNSELYKLHLKRQLEKGRKDDGDEGI